MLSVVLIAYNEEKNIEMVIREYYNEIIKKIAKSEMIVCEDGSTDKTPRILKELTKELKIKVYSSSERKGYLEAAKRAIKKASGDWIFFSDSDGEHDPKDFWKLYKNRNKADLISGKRIKNVVSPLRKVLSFGFSKIINKYFGINCITDFNSGFKLFNKEIQKKIVPKIKYIKYGFSTEMIIRTLNAGYKVVEIPVMFKQRINPKGRDFDTLRLPKVILEQVKGMKKLRDEMDGR